jgi:hypothetical protein
MRKVVSSQFTFLFKFVFPCGWLAAGFYALAQGTSGAAGVFICLWLGVSLLLFRHYMFPLKKVSLVEGFLRVSNFWREVDVPLSEIESVRAVGYGLLQGPMPGIVVKLKNPTEFGEMVRFIPGRYYQDVVADLNRAAELGGASLTRGRA